MLKYFCCHRDKKNGKNTGVLDILQGRLLIKKILDDNAKMAELTRGFCAHSPWAGTPTQHCRPRQGLLAEQPMGKPRATERRSGCDHYLFIENRKKERLKNMGDNSPTQLSCPQRLEPTKSVAAFGDMAVIEARLGQDSHDMGWPAVLQGPPL